MSLAEVVSSGKKVKIAFTPPVLLSELLGQSSIFFDMPCGGRQRCKKCRIKAAGDLSPISAFERTSLSSDELINGIRFACVAEALGDVTLTVDGGGEKEVILTEGAAENVRLDPLGKKFGVAVDIGTTTVATYLYNLKNGLLLATASKRNPQAVFGADVVSRLDYAMHGGLERLSSVITGCISDLVNELCTKSGVTLDDIDAAVVAGNTAMIYLFCNLDPSSIAFAPFKQDNYFGCFLYGTELNININAPVYLVRSISSYVGGDITAAIIASGFHDDKIGKPRLLADIGTNGEMALLSGGRLLCCSTAAGSAFEGSGIHAGMTSKEGAISGASFTGAAFKYEVIGGVKPEGICGSGILDITAALLEAGVIDETGHLSEDGHSFEENLCEFEAQDAFLLPDTDIVVTQKDIRMVQLAKSAIRAGIDTLLHEAGISAENISEFRLAGGFGTYLNISSAVKIGMIPDKLISAALSVGNAAGAGATMLLLNRELIDISEKTAISAETVDLTTNQTFVDGYIENMYF